MKTPPNINWIHNPTPLRKDEVKLSISRTADAKTTAALERQALCNEFSSVKEYLQDLIAALLADAEEDTVLANDGRFVSACYAYDFENDTPRSV